MASFVFTNDIEEIIISDDNEDDVIETVPNANNSDLTISSVVSCSQLELGNSSSHEDELCTIPCSDSGTKLTLCFSSNNDLECSNVTVGIDGSSGDNKLCTSREVSSDAGFIGASADKIEGSLPANISMSDRYLENLSLLDHDYCKQVGFQYISVTGSEQNLDNRENCHFSESGYIDPLAVEKTESEIVKKAEDNSQESSTSIENHQKNESPKDEHKTSKIVNPIFLLCDAIINAVGESINFKECAIQDIVNLATSTVNKLVTEERKQEHSVELLLQQNYRLKQRIKKLKAKARRFCKHDQF